MIINMMNDNEFAFDASCMLKIVCKLMVRMHIGDHRILLKIEGNRVERILKQVIQKVEGNHIE